MGWFADAIKNAAASPLGILALAMLVLAWIAWRFFDREPDWRVRFLPFAMRFAGIGFAVISLIQGAAEPTRNGPLPRPCSWELPLQEWLKCIRQQQ